MSQQATRERIQKRSLFDKIWDRHVVARRSTGPQLIYVDRHFLHDGSFHAFRQMRDRGLTIRRPDRVFAVPDHYVPTLGRTLEYAANAETANMMVRFDENMRWGGISHFPLQDTRQGIVHVVCPEQGLSLPGMIIVCTDSHTSTHGAMGAIAFGIGQSESVLVLSSQTIWQNKPHTMRIHVDGIRGQRVSAKDIVLAVIAQIGADGAVGYAIEFDGPVIRAMEMEERLTVCNMAIEAGARCGMISPDDITFQYLHGRPYAPTGAEWDEALREWQGLPSDPGAVFDRDIKIDITNGAPMVTWGTSPDTGIAIDAVIPDPALERDESVRSAMEAALVYMDLKPGTPMLGVPIDRVFIGSCTNSRLSDLREAAKMLRGRRACVPGLVVPGSGEVKRAAEREGLDRVFKEAGLEWREAGCSMCVAMNGDAGRPGERIASTTNRNFVGRQGSGVRTHLMSPVMAAAAAVTGKLCDVRHMR
ncbi:3-isopropylmalate dehydratase large subunit [Allopusillimonas soli]|uniref:3-isopropylmalate dehydratase n=1 Tax=Allopusillimonas soli TaxID=659016 RepID=A0A853FJD6_9BURK|nr:3-isopropylmalate dehydratase large subunit [Allopusillimonas soli]NYT38056.1 3-isopropylmalate dehydratase large subunit [Allopusillimonas soli]TEA73942.1 3-isopropylmalate dehydratase large subunit [Allopusillimonas soli]